MRGLISLWANCWAGIVFRLIQDNAGVSDIQWPKGVCQVFELSQSGERWLGRCIVVALGP
jgi:hypothetical protein